MNNVVVGMQGRPHFSILKDKPQVSSILTHSQRSRIYKRPSAVHGSNGWNGASHSPQHRDQQDYMSGLASPSQNDDHEGFQDSGSLTQSSFAVSSSGSQPESFPRPAEAYTPLSGPGTSSSDAQGQYERPKPATGRKRGERVVLKVAKEGVYARSEEGPLKLAKPPPAGGSDDIEGKPDLGTFWGLLILGLAYVHHSTSGFALPALLPLITPELELTDTQGSLLTSGYTVLYALALVPVGFLADKADRPRLLAGGLVVWSALTMWASKVNGFGELLATRIVFACAQATQNPICFSLIPELFRKDRTTAMAAYNSAIYIGRALSFAAVIVAGKLGMAKATGDIGVTMVPLNSLDLSHVSILYTQGEMAAITPIYDYSFSILHGTVTISSWRQLLFWLGPPGLAIAALALLTLDEPRKPSGNALGDVFSSSKFTSSATRDLSRSQKDSFDAPKVATKAKKEAVAKKDGDASMWESVKELVSNPVFQAVTLAAAFNDVGSWALVGWQATFYQRVYELGPETYAPALAGILPVGGILGGVGGGLMGDWLSRKGGLHYLTSGATIACAPVLVANILAPEASQSFAALLVGFALSEMWRAPAAIMIRDISPSNLGSTGSAVHLCVRNLVGGLGPLSVAYLSNRVGLQKAMLVVPTMFFLSGVGFYFAHRIQSAEKEKKLLAAGSNGSNAPQ